MTAEARYRRAVGIEYQAREKGTPGGAAPAVNVTAEHMHADQVVALAHRYGIPVREDSGLARMLGELELDQSIPAELFEAVATVLAELERQQPSSRRRST